MNFLLVQELNLSEKNLLNTISYAAAVKEAITSTGNEHSFVIALFGQWGSGKSSSIKTAKKDLEASNKQKIKFMMP